MKYLVSAVLAAIIFVLLYGLLFGFSFVNIHTSGILAQERATVQREVFEQSASQQRGNVQNLERLMLEYQRAQPAHQAMLRSTILETYSYVDIDDLPPHQAAFIADLRRVP